MAGGSQVLGPGPHRGDSAVSPGVTGAERAAEPAGAAFPGPKEALGASLGPGEEGLRGEGLGTFWSPAGRSARQGGGNYRCCQAASSPAFESLKNNLHRMSHPMACRWQQLRRRASPSSWAGGISHKRSSWTQHLPRGGRPQGLSLCPGPFRWPDAPASVHTHPLPSAGGGASGPSGPRGTRDAGRGPAAEHPSFLPQGPAAGANVWLRAGAVGTAVHGMAEAPFPPTRQSNTPPGPKLWSECVPPNSFAETLTPEVMMVLGGDQVSRLGPP